jgi:hypothetical protein
VLEAQSVSLIESCESAKLIATADAQLRGTLAHAYACSVLADGRCVRATISRSQSAPLLAALRASTRVALVVCHIESYQCLQLKGRDARLVEPSEAIARSASEYCKGFARFSAVLGYPADVMQAHAACAPEDTVAIKFTVDEAFIQTPGPAAGRPLGAPS